jgi:hypothetical protein
LPLSRDCGMFFPRSPKRLAGYADSKTALRAFSSWLRQEGIRTRFRIDLPIEVTDIQPLIWDGWRIIVNYTYLLDLSKLTQDEVSSNVYCAPQRRQQARRSLRDGITVARIADGDRIENLVQRSLVRNDANRHASLRRRVIESYLEPTAPGYGVIAGKSGKDLATVFVAHDASTAYYVFGGNEGSSISAGVSAMVESIREAKLRGLTWFDFNGSSVPSIERYIRTFGGSLTPYFTVTNIPAIAESSRRRVRSGLFRLRSSLRDSDHAVTRMTLKNS